MIVGAIFGLAVGLIAAPSETFIIKTVRETGHMPGKASLQFFGLIGGTNVVALPASTYFSDEEFFTGFVFGWALPVLPWGVISYVRYMLKTRGL